ncbi:SURF1 family protein [Novosphingobium album (ex Liu et al. 2023)]|uniref:SURF1 family protein n=1 Tax=Novosphingobium album (ex Liu et al. 2023) TaxID=3031130 RepID=UPI003D16749D
MAAARPAPRGGKARTAVLGLMLLLTAAFSALSVWQVERREWKHALIAAVESRVHAAPVAAPGPEHWASLSAEHDAYRHVRVTGRFLHDRETLVRAVSDLGSGYWVITPLDTGHFTVLVNRGFVAPGERNKVRRDPVGTIALSGLLRVTEPGGGFLRSNDPKTGNWYSRDVAAIAAARGILRPAPYFIDADAMTGTSTGPVAGLTVVRFADNHAVYALTWFAMALLCAYAARSIVPGNRRSRKAFA